ncbi:NtrC family transcriptional regulator [Bdellovibrio bacteriovorus]|uniref:NtrC family transcriptional regulator n=1 Tax=Bdellovibrio bacteriovorus TaxID=959 RepID=A0A150WIW9_BDEBC|nr:sigma-54 dependent transcriptional regulator [Bdellovibrio bacteriovorus]KYG63737.1 NtrC family transcriptional regulator [Bdellovibrio bacteriovorus]
MDKHTQKQILLIEDDIDLAELATAYFRQKDIQITHSTDPLEALKQVTSGKLAPDAIITDLNLPLMSGVDFIRQLRAEGMNTPIILITVSNDVETAVQAIEAGAYDFVVKPLHFPQLLISAQRAFKYNHLSNENRTLRETIDISKGQHPEGIIGKSESLLRIMDLAKRVSKSASTVSITGESGTGKEVFAKAIHNWSPRSKKPFVAINCSAIPENLLESELFGHAKGSFTGAVDKKVGLFEEADGGTLFLDEIGDLNLTLQAKLLRVLQEKEIKRVGENQSRSVDVRVIAATHKDLRHEVQEKRFREDLFFRLNVIPIRIPPLRERREDIIPLAEHFLRKFNTLNGTNLTGFKKSAKEFLLTHPWRGNVRELENAIERAVVLATGPEIDVTAFTLFEESVTQQWSHDEDAKNAFIFRFGDDIKPLSEVEKKYVQFVYERNNRAKELTAKALGIDRKTLYRKLQEIEGGVAANSPAELSHNS